VADIYTELRADRVVLVYNRFVSALAQKLEVVDLLPVPESLLDDEAPERIAGSYLEEPDASTILSHLLPTYLEVTIYRALLESTASEHGARMTAMRNASENAGELIDSYTLQMNRARQSEITQQILEVVAGADALE
jgi:F-type H+-transporting ATPase subunit gamma